MKLAEVFDKAIGGAGGVGFKAYDGSKAGDLHAPVVLEVRSPLAVRYIATSPGDLGLARAYISGHLEVHGDMYTALRTLTERVVGDLTWQQKTDIVRSIGLTSLRRPPLPPEEVRLHGFRHSKGRDAAATRTPYPVSN